jgi:hypothetical protein
MDFLDLNSIALGLMPVLNLLGNDARSLSTTTRYWRSRLVHEFGAFSDIALFDSEVLSWLRSKCFRKRNISASIADKYCVEYQAAVDYQWRINKFMTGVMHQAPDLVLPQHSDNQTNVSTSHQTSAPVPIPHAAMLLLLCTPPFAPLLSCFADSEFLFSHDRSVDLPPQRSKALGLPRYMPFMQSEGSCGRVLWSLYCGSMCGKMGLAHGLVWQSKCRRRFVNHSILLDPMFLCTVMQFV